MPWFLWSMVQLEEHPVMFFEPLKFVLAATPAGLKRDDRD